MMLPQSIHHAVWTNNPLTTSGIFVCLIPHALFALLPYRCTFPPFAPVLPSDRNKCVANRNREILNFLGYGDFVNQLWFECSCIFKITLTIVLNCHEAKGDSITYRIDKSLTWSSSSVGSRPALRTIRTVGCVDNQAAGTWRSGQ